MERKSLGYSGESLAAHYLRSKGYEILENNFTVRGGEIDIIARRGPLLVFVEVKTRTNKNFGEGDESLTNLKKRRLTRAIQRYLDSKTETRDPDYRVDLMEINLDYKTKKMQKITHFEDVEL